MKDIEQSEVTETHSLKRNSNHFRKEKKENKFRSFFQQNAINMSVCSVAQTENFSEPKAVQKVEFEEPKLEVVSLLNRSK